MIHRYKIRHYTNGRSKDGKEYTNYSISVPSDIAEALPDEIQFSPRMTDEGLLYEPIMGEPTHVNLPDWAKQAAKNSNGEKKKQATKKPAKAKPQVQPSESQPQEKENLTTHE